MNDPYNYDFDMREDEHESAILLPEWAVGLADGNLLVGAQLPTRDGRRMGNAHIVAIIDKTYASLMKPVTVYLVLTDAGNSMVMLDTEVHEAFYPPKYVSNVDEVVKKFWREDIPLTYK